MRPREEQDLVTVRTGNSWTLGISITNIILDFRRPVIPLLARAGQADIDFLTVGDHVSFRNGLGLDGLIHATAILAAQDRLPVQIGVYVLALRHPVTVARQIADINRMTPGRLRLAVGAGGEDRHEYAVCGVDASHRGRRTDEALQALRPLLRGGEVSMDGKYLSFDDAVIQPAVWPELPVIIGGRSEAALRRTALYGDGWLGMWASPRRFSEAIQQIDDLAGAAGRPVPTWRHGMTVWCSIGPDRRREEERLGQLMTSRYGIPPERFARWCPAGPPQAIAEFLADYITAGCTDVGLVVASESPEEALSGAEHVRRELGSLLPA